MTDVERALKDLHDRGLASRMRMISGPQGPRVLLDGRPVLLLCSDNYLGLADHPRVREAAADAAMRYGAGAGASRTGSGTMRIHRRLEERLASFQGHEAALLFGSRYLTNVGVIPALAGPGQVVFCDAESHPSIGDGVRLAEAESFVYRHGDVEHLAWGLQQVEGRGTLIVTDALFATGDLAPLADIVELARRYDTRVMVDESDALGTVGPGGRGLAGASGVEEEIDVLVGSLSKSLGSYGAFVCCDRAMARYLSAVARTLSHSTAPSPPAVAAAMASLALLQAEPRRLEKLQRNASVIREALAGEGSPAAAGATQILSIAVGDAAAAGAAVERALDRGLFVLASHSDAGASTVRLTVMASHTKTELREAARTLAKCLPAPTRRPVARVPEPVAARPSRSGGAVFDGLAEAA